ncbi:retrovirus-related pol polyprotein from transposon TNT 1-94 [Tanacetum coccineum]
MSGTIPPPVTNFRNTRNPNRVEDVLQTNNTNSTGTNNVTHNIVNEDLSQLLDSRGGSLVGRIALRLEFNAFKALEGDKVKETYTMLNFFLNELEQKDVKIPQAEVNATFVNSLPKKWLGMNQTQRTNNAIKNDSLATLFGKYNYKEELIDQIYKSETKRFTIQSSTSKDLISNTSFQVSDSDVEEYTRSSSEFLPDLNAEFHVRALLGNQKRFYKRSGRVGSARKLMDKSNETCFACGKQGHFQQDCPTNKTSFPSYPSTNKSYNKPKFLSNSSSSQQQHQNAENNQKDYKGKYKALKAELALFTKKIDVVSKNKSEKGLVIEKWNSSKVTLDQLLTKQVPGNIVRALGGRGRREETISSKEVVFTKEEKSPSDIVPEVTFDTASECYNQEPLPPFPKLSGAEPIGTSNDVIPHVDLIQTSTVSNKTKHVTKKESSVKAIKKKAQTKSPSVLDPCHDKKADSSTE